MSEEEIKRQLKLSKQQNKNERYDYLCSQFNCVNYAIKLEKYTNKLQQENKKQKEVIDKAMKCINYNTKYRNGADIYQFVDIESEILGPLKFILEMDEENGNAYLKEFNDWLKEVE